MLLLELCGTRERAAFWLSFSNVARVLAPLIFALDFSPDRQTGRSVVFEMAAQLRFGSIGFMVTLALLSLILLRFIPQNKPSVRAGTQR